MKLADLSKEEQSMLRTVVCPDAADEHINYYLRVCHAQAVDPFSGLLYMTVRTSQGKKKPMVAASIDGARAKASRTEDYAGSDEPEYDSEDAPNPRWCRATVYRMVKGERCAFSAKIRWEEFKPAAPNDFQWKAKPYHMLGKCAEMAALRKAFPESVPASNEEEYTDEPAPKSEKAETAIVNKSPITARWASAVAAFKLFGIDEPKMLAKISKKDIQQVTNDDIESLFSWYEEMQRDEVPPPPDVA